MTTENTQQVAVADKREAWQNFQTELQQRATELGAQLPSNVSRDRFINVTLAAVKQTPSILVATPRSLMAAIAKAAQDGLMPDGREGVITVYNQKVPGSNPVRYEDVAQWNPMAYGLRKRARELDGIIIDAQVVFEGDEFEYELGDEPKIKHKPAMVEAKDASAGVAVYAIFRHPTEGILHREVMTKAQVFATMNQSRAKNSLMWTTFWTEGWRKAVVRRGMKSVPVSPKLEQVISRVDDDFEFDAVPVKQISRATPPTPPAEEEEGKTLGELAEERRIAERARDPQSSAPIAEQHIEDGEAPAPTPPTPPADDVRVDTSDVGRFLNQIDETLATASDVAQMEALWDDLDVQRDLAGDEDALTRAFDLKKHHKTRIERVMATKAGQGDLLGGSNG